MMAPQAETTELSYAVKHGAQPGSATARERPLTVVDHDLHGLLTVRLIDPSPAAKAAVARPFGTPGTPPEGETDCVVRFVVEHPYPTPIEATFRATEAHYR